MDNVIVPLAWFSAAFAFFLISKRQYGDFIAPVGVIVGGGCVSLGLYHLRLLPYEGLGLGVYIAIAIGFGGFVAGAYGARHTRYGQWARMRQTSHRHVAYQQSPLDASLEAFLYLVGILATAGWVIATILFVRDYSLGTILSQPFLLASSFQRQFVGSLNVVGILALPTYVLLRASRFEPRSLLLSRLVVLSAMTGLVLAGIKTYVLFSFTVALAVWLMSVRNTSRLRALTVFGASAVGFFVVYDRLIDIFVPKVFGDASFGPLDVLQRPYEYASGAWQAMSTIVEAPPSQVVFGQVTLGTAWKLLAPLWSLAGSVPRAEPFVDIGFTYHNTYTLLGGIVWDFGFVGLAASMIALGFASTWVFFRAAVVGTWVALLQYGLIFYGLVVAIHVFDFRQNFLVLFLFVTVAGAVIRRRSQPTTTSTPLVRSSIPS